MTERLKLSLKGVWIIAGLAAVVLPVFLPSVRHDGIADSPIAIATLTLFILSFPSSVFALIAAAFLSLLLRFDPWSIEADYMNVVWLFALGAVQWFWIAPRIFRFRRLFKRLEMREASRELILAEAEEIDSSEPSDFAKATPLERVLNLGLKDDVRG
jgi:hypothetical protein